MKDQSQFLKYEYFSFLAVYENIDPILEIYIRPLVEFDRHLKEHMIKKNNKNRIKSKSNETTEMECSEGKKKMKM